MKVNYQGLKAAVAPFVGAWIETVVEPPCSSAVTSHPSWVRGLKHARKGCTASARGVAPFVGAWIETKVLLFSRLIY